MKNLFKCATIIGLIFALNVDYVEGWPWSKKTEAEDASVEEQENNETANQIKSLNVSTLETAVKTLTATVSSTQTEKNKCILTSDISFLYAFECILLSARDILNLTVMYVNKLSSNLSLHGKQEKKGDANADATKAKIEQLINNFFGTGTTLLLNKCSVQCILLIQYMLQYPDCPTAGLDVIKTRIVSGRGMKVFAKNKPLAGVLADAVANIKLLKKTLSDIVQQNGFEIENENNINNILDHMILILNFFTTLISYMSGSANQNEIKNELEKFLALNIENDDKIRKAFLQEEVYDEIRRCVDEVIKYSDIMERIFSTKEGQNKTKQCIDGIRKSIYGIIKFLPGEQEQNEIEDYIVDDGSNSPIDLDEKKSDEAEYDEEEDSENTRTRQNQNAIDNNSLDKRRSDNQRQTSRRNSKTTQSTQKQRPRAVDDSWKDEIRTTQQAPDSKAVY